MRYRVSSLVVLTACLAVALPVVAQTPQRPLHGLAKIDSDHDGKVSWSEYSAAAKVRFDKADTNHDGTLDAAEMKAAHHARTHNARKGDGTWGAPKDSQPPYEGTIPAK